MSSLSPDLLCTWLHFTSLHLQCCLHGLPSLDCHILSIVLPSSLQLSFFITGILASFFLYYWHSGSFICNICQLPPISSAISVNCHPASVTDHLGHLHCGIHLCCHCYIYPTMSLSIYMVLYHCLIPLILS